MWWSRGIESQVCKWSLWYSWPISSWNSRWSSTRSECEESISTRCTLVWQILSRGRICSRIKKATTGNRTFQAKRKILRCYGSTSQLFSVEMKMIHHHLSSQMNTSISLKRRWRMFMTKLLVHPNRPSGTRIRRRSKMAVAELITRHAKRRRCRASLASIGSACRWFFVWMFQKLIFCIYQNCDGSGQWHWIIHITHVFSSDRPYPSHAFIYMPPHPNK